MNDIRILKKKKQYAIVLMVIIIFLVLLLMITTISYEFMYQTTSSGHHNIHKPHKPKPEDILFTVVTSNDINLFVDAKDALKESVGDSLYKDITSDAANAKIAIKTKEELIKCKYDVTFKIEENSFKNYYLDNKVLRELNNQLILRMDGFKSTNNTTEHYTYEIDVNKIENSEYKIEDIIIKNNNFNKYVEQNWIVTLIFRNYKNYNQTNNSGKRIIGELKFNITECE